MPYRNGEVNKNLQLFRHNHLTFRYVRYILVQQQDQLFNKGMI